MASLGERLAVRFALNRLRTKSRGDKDAQDAISALLGNREALDEFIESARTEHSAPRAAGAPGADGEFIKWLLQWIVDNKDVIIEIIKTIIDLFAAKPQS